MKIAQRFSAGYHVKPLEKSRRDERDAGFLSSLRDCRVLPDADPALKRWAIFEEACQACPQLRAGEIFVVSIKAWKNFHFVFQGLENKD